MDNTAYVVTDGSHNGTLKVGGIAGKVVIQGQPLRQFQRCIFNAYDSTIVEFLAIEDSLRMINEQIRAGVKVDHVVIATDSLDLLCVIDPQQVIDKFPEAIPFIERSKRYHKLNEKILSLSKSMNISFKLQKVKAHVPDDQASALEKIHNEVDLLAKEPKDRVVHAIKVDGFSKSKCFSVMIPKDMSAEALKHVKKASLALIKQGYVPRVLLEDGASNPLDRVIKMYGKDAGKDAERAVRSAMTVTMATERVEDNAIPISGINRSRARHWLAKEGRVIDEWELNGFDGALMNDVIKSTLGDSYPIRVIGHPEHRGRMTAEASELVLHHGDEKLMPEHFEMMTRALKIHSIDRILVTHPRFNEAEPEDTTPRP